MSDLADRIRLAAKRIGGLDRLAEEINVPRRTLGNWLQGRSPKPENIRGIAEATNVSLNWLVTGDGFPEEDGFSVAMRRLDRQSTPDTIDDGFTEAFGNALARVAGSGEHDATRPSSAAPDNPTVELRRRIIRAVKEAYAAAKIVVSSDERAIIAMDIFAELRQRVRDIGDDREVEIVLAHLMHNLQRDLADAAATPGSGKRSAS